MLRAIRLSIEAVDPRLEAVARTLGAGRVRAFLTVTLRLALPGVLAGALLMFARSLGEFGATITLAANIAGETRTLPTAIYTYLNQPGGDPGAARLSILAVVISFAALAGSEWMTRRARKG
jgi:molybdate transport system permease protein